MCKKIMKGLIKMIRGITYDKQLFKSNDFALMVNKFFNGNDGKVNGCNLSASGNTIVISSGWFIASGYYTNLPSQEVIEVSQSGTLVYEIDLSKTNTTQSFNQGEFKIITETPTQEDLFGGGNIYQLPVAEITTDGTNASIISTLWQNIKGEAISSDRFALLSGTATSPMLSLSLPNGFTGENCVVLSVSYKENDNDGWIYTSSATISGSSILTPIPVNLLSSSVFTMIPSYEQYSYKILLMKIS